MTENHIDNVFRFKKTKVNAQIFDLLEQRLDRTGRLVFCRTRIFNRIGTLGVVANHREGVRQHDDGIGRTGHLNRVVDRQDQIKSVDEFIRSFSRFWILNQGQVEESHLALVCQLGHFANARNRLGELIDYRSNRLDEFSNSLNDRADLLADEVAEVDAGVFESKIQTAQRRFNFSVFDRDAGRPIRHDFRLDARQVRPYSGFQSNGNVRVQQGVKGENVAERS